MLSNSVLNGYKKFSFFFLFYLSFDCSETNPNLMFGAPNEEFAESVNSLVRMHD